MTDQQPPQFAPAPSVESLLGSGFPGHAPFPTPQPVSQPQPQADEPAAPTTAELPHAAETAPDGTGPTRPDAPSAAPVEPIVTDLGVATDHEVPFLQMTVEAVAASLITKLHAAEAAAREHLAAMEAEAARRCELLTAQAELDAELIRLYARRESHALLAAARAKLDSQEPNAPIGDAEAGLEAVGEAVLRGVEALDAHLQRLHTFHSDGTVIPDGEAGA